MTAAEITEKSANMMHLVPVVVRANKAAQNDWVVVENVPGVYIVDHGFTNQTSTATGQGVVETLTYGKLQINNGGSAYTATTTSIAYNNGTGGTRTLPYYVRTVSGEIALVRADSGAATTSGTLTVERAALGTTASATGLANDDWVEVMNQVILGSATVGYTTFTVLPMPQDPKFAMFA